MAKKAKKKAKASKSKAPARKAKAAGPSKAKKSSWLPSGFTAITPHLVCSGAAEAIDFYKNAFGAKEKARMPGPGGQGVMHAELKIGDSVVMLADEFPDMGGECASKSPKSLGGTSVTMHLYVPDVDAAFERAVRAGATVAMPVADMFWGDRYGQVTDPFGHRWSLATHKSDPSPKEMMEAAAAMFGGG